ncbi:MAG: hypothetical protein U5K37_05050 [Natrialbaceae archaeon]|nr:hypothetical protein [Natrialbaceae archaeon]
MNIAASSLLRQAPISTLLTAVLPLVLGSLQVLNAQLHAESLLPAAAFAAVMICFSWVATGHLTAAHRRQHLEQDIDGWARDR